MIGVGSSLRVAAYLRCSTTEQANDGLSLDAQATRIESWASATGATIVETVIDAGVSGTKPLASREGGQRIAALMSAKSPDVDAVIVMRLDRLGRDASESLALFKRFRNGKVGLVSVVDQVDLATAHGRAMAGVSAVFAELERSLIAQRTSDALAELKSQLRPWNHPPLGWTAVEGQLVPHHQEQKTLTLMRTLRSAGMSYRAVALHLREVELPTKRGGRWEAATVRSTLMAQPTSSS
jgi:DNA invertase Pin-like site-specific DNA recombinase